VKRFLKPYRRKRDRQLLREHNAPYNPNYTKIPNATPDAPLVFPLPVITHQSDF
jgi:hypothetical protein